MPTKSVPLAMSGMDNKSRPEALPKDKFRNAVNVVFTDSGSIQFPRPGKTRIYSGECHSYYETSFISLFVEAGYLKKLNADGSATTITTGMGADRVYYTTIGDVVYFCNALKAGRVKDGSTINWGVIPYRQPDLAATLQGGLFAGTYHVAITWISNGEESGTIESSFITVDEGDGIRLSNFPIPPADIELIAVYVSGLNSEDLYLYGEYSPNVGVVNVTNKICTIPLQTQFKYPPAPQNTIVSHHGRIYYAMRNVLFWTDAQQYWLQSVNNYLLFDSDIQTINSCPNVLYVGTNNKFGKVTNIDASDGSLPIFESLQECGTVQGSETYDPDGVSSYVMSNRGVLKLTPEAVNEITYENVAIPFYTTGASTVIEYDGSKYLVGVFQDGVQNQLANKDYNTSELVRGSL